MAKDIWLPDSKTHVVIENGQIKTWETMTMIKKSLNKSNFGFKKEKEDFENRTDV